MQGADSKSSKIFAFCKLFSPRTRIAKMSLHLRLHLHLSLYRENTRALARRLNTHGGGATLWLVRLASLAASALAMVYVASVRLCQHDRPPQVQRQLQLLSSGSTRLLDHRVGSRARVLGYRQARLHVFHALSQLVPQFDLPREGSVRTSLTQPLLCRDWFEASGVTSCLRREGSSSSPAFVRVGSAHACSR